MPRELVEVEVVDVGRDDVPLELDDVLENPFKAEDIVLVDDAGVVLDDEEIALDDVGEIEAVELELD